MIKRQKGKPKKVEKNEENIGVTTYIKLLNLYEKKQKNSIRLYQIFVLLILPLGQEHSRLE